MYICPERIATIAKSLDLAVLGKYIPNIIHLYNYPTLIQAETPIVKLISWRYFLMANVGFLS